jgi:hypothetical protein
LRSVCMCRLSGLNAFQDVVCTNNAKANTHKRDYYAANDLITLSHCVTCLRGRRRIRPDSIPSVVMRARDLRNPPQKKTNPKTKTKAATIATDDFPISVISFCPI